MAINGYLFWCEWKAIVGLLRRNNFGLIYEISKDVATAKSKMAIFDDTMHSFDLPYPANPHEYRHNPYRVSALHFRCW